MTTENKTCVYCEIPERETRVWKQTGEVVCYECRLNFLEEEFQN